MSPSEMDLSFDPSADSIDLSATAPFRLGGLEITPPTRLVRVVGGRDHVAAPGVLKVLIALQKAAGGVVSRDTLVRRCWDGRVVGEDAINRAIAKVRQLAELSDPPAFVLETIPRVGYRLIAESADEAPILPADAAADRAGLPRRALIAGGVATGGAAAAALAYGWRRHQAPADPLVAVLPFDNLSPDPQMGYFADGLSEDILNALIRGGGVRVTSRTSSFTFRGASKAKAASVLRADYLLDGSVLREGGRLRVNAHLNDVASQQTLWSETYDRDVGQGLAIEDEVAGKVAMALKVRFAGRGSADRTVDPVAYDLYLRGRDATRIHTPESLRAGNQWLRSAVALSPNFSSAWFELAKNYWRNGYLEAVPDQLAGFEQGREAAQRAIALDPRNGAAFGVIAQMTPLFGHWREIDLGLTKGLSISPNDPNLLLWRGQFLLSAGRIQEAAQWARRAQAVDPFDLLANHRLWEAETYLGRFAAAEAAATRIAMAWPDQIAAYWDRVWLRIVAGRDAEAIALLRDPTQRPSDELEERDAMARALASAHAGGPAARQDAVRRLLDMAKAGVGYAGNAMVLLARLGASDEAVEVARALFLRRGSLTINAAIQFRSSSRFPLHGEAEPFTLFHPFMAPLRRAGRLNDVFDGVGLTAFWTVAGGPDR